MLCFSPSVKQLETSKYIPYFSSSLTLSSFLFFFSRFSVSLSLFLFLSLFLSSFPPVSVAVFKATLSSRDREELIGEGQCVCVCDSVCVRQHVWDRVLAEDQNIRQNLEIRLRSDWERDEFEQLWSDLRSGEDEALLLHFAGLVCDVCEDVLWWWWLQLFIK